jgi:phosphonate transport system permease protein
MSWTLYMVETNIRSATLIGILTGTGIGFVFNLYYTSFRYDCAGLVVIITIVAVLVIEAISNKARRSMI